MKFFSISRYHTPIDSPCWYNARLHHTGIVLFASDAWLLLPCMYNRGFTLVVTLHLLKGKTFDDWNMTLTYLRCLPSRTVSCKISISFFKYPSPTNNGCCRIYVLFFQNVHWLVIIVCSTINLLLENTGITFRVYLFPIGEQMLI